MPFGSGLKNMDSRDLLQNYLLLFIINKTSDAGSVIAPAAPMTPTGNGGGYIGNKNSRKFHRPDWPVGS